MVKKIIKLLLRRRHFWRDVGFDDLTEIYANRLMATIALSLVGIFVPVYLYGMGYPVRTICYFFTVFFAARFAFDFMTAFLVGRFGAKRIIFCSQIVQLISLLLYASLPHFNWPLELCAAVNGLASSLYFIAFHTDFSKVRHIRHGGKEVSYAVNFEKLGTVVGPVLGGILATRFNPQLVFYVACGLVVLAAIPFFATKEAIRTRQHITFWGLKLYKRLPDQLSYLGMGVENSASVNLWPLYLAVVLTVPHIYKTIGILSAIGVATSFLFIHVIGKLIDNRRIRKLYQYGVAANAAVHVARPFIATVPGAAILNVVNEQATNSYRVPYIKAFYDQASDLPGYRIAYITCLEMSARTGQVLFWGSLFIVGKFVAPVALMKSAFVGAAVVSLLLYAERYKALKR